MKSKKESKDKICTKCAVSYPRDEGRMTWAIKFPYWICRDCAKKAHEGFSKISKGKVKDGVGMLADQMGFRFNKKKADRKMKDPRKMEKAREKLLKKGFSPDEIDKGWEKMGWKK